MSDQDKIENTPNPFDFETTTGAYAPALTPEIIAALREQVRTMDPDEAAAILHAAGKAVEERQAANEVLEMILGSVGKVLGIVL